MCRGKGHSNARRCELNASQKYAKVEAQRERRRTKSATSQAIALATHETPKGFRFEPAAPIKLPHINQYDAAVRFTDQWGESFILRIHDGAPLGVFTPQGQPVNEQVARPLLARLSTWLEAFLSFLR